MAVYNGLRRGIAYSTSGNGDLDGVIGARPFHTRVEGSALQPAALALANPNYGVEYICKKLRRCPCSDEGK